MDEQLDAADAPHRMDDVRAIARELPPANDLESEASATAPTIDRTKELREKLYVVFLRVRWALLALLVTILFSVVAARLAHALARTDLQRWCLSVLGMAGVLAAVVLLDAALQRSDGATYDLVRKQESGFMAAVVRKSAQMIDEK